jgi:prefoldin subunit 5
MEKRYYEGQIHELNRRIKELENKVDELQERIDQYEWAMGIGE